MYHDWAPLENGFSRIRSPPQPPSANLGQKILFLRNILPVLFQPAMALGIVCSGPSSKLSWVQSVHGSSIVSWKSKNISEKKKISNLSFEGFIIWSDMSFLMT